MKEYYIFKYGKRMGPYSIHELKSREIKNDTQIWSPETNKWLSASEFPELAEILIETPSSKIFSEEKSADKKYYVFRSNQKSGPYTIEELKELPIYAATEICLEENKTWKRAFELPELMDIITIIPEKPEGKKYFDYYLASKWQRLGAAFLDGMFIFVLCIPLYFIFSLSIFAPDKPETHSLKDYNLLATFSEIAISFSITILAASYFYNKFCGNAGHAILKLKVISSIDGSDFNKSSQGILREGLKRFLGFLVIVNLWILFDKNNQNIYDKVLETYVVEKKPNS